MEQKVFIRNWIKEYKRNYSKICYITLNIYIRLCPTTRKTRKKQSKEIILLFRKLKPHPTGIEWNKKE